MAKSKVKSKPRKRKKSMATTAVRKKTKRRNPATSRHLSAHHSKPHTPKKRRKAKGLFDAAPGMNLTKNIVGNTMGGIGGLVPLAARAIKMPMWLRIVGGMGLAFTATALGATNVGAGISGATAYAIGDEVLGHKIHEFHDDDDSMEDTEYVDPQSLSDSGMDDEYGDPVYLHDNGTMYSMDENGDLTELDDAYSLSDSDMQSVSGINLMDAYSLSGAYSLQ